MKVESILGPAVVVGIIVYFQTNRDNKLKYVTQERKEWRERIRFSFSELISLVSLKNGKYVTENYTKTKEIIMQLKLSLNHTDDEDIKILKKLEELEKEIIEKENSDINKKEELKENKLKDNKIEELTKMFQILLKYEWEKAKNEAKNMKAIYEGLALVLVLIFIYCYNKGFSYIKQLDIIKVFFNILSKYLAEFTIFIVLILLSTEFIKKEKRETLDKKDDKHKSIKFNRLKEILEKYGVNILKILVCLLLGTLFLLKLENRL